MLTYHLTTEEEKYAIGTWKYPGEYALYDLPSYDEMKAKKLGFMNPERAENFYSFYDRDTYVGFVNILEEPEEVFIGIGVSPEHCGRGYGQQMLLGAYEMSKRLYPAKPLYLEVRTWNTRAMRCYEKAGFEIAAPAYRLETGIGSGTFYKMTRK